MDDDLKLLLSEYTRLASTSPSFTDSLSLIPLLLRTGSFSPSRLDRWPFQLISTQIETDASYRDKISSAFLELVSLTNSPAEGFSLNEKKAVSFLVATRDFSSIHNCLSDITINNQRILLACLEYSCLTSSLNIQVRNLSLPCPQIDTLTPKFKAKYPLLSSMLVNPTIKDAKLALDRLYSSLSPATEQELITVLECAARCLSPILLHSEIIKPIWGTRNEQLAIVVLESLYLCPELSRFCEEYLKDLRN